MELSKKQSNLIKDIEGTEVHDLEVLGSRQSGKTYSICIGIWNYIVNIQKDYPNQDFNGVIVGWTIETLRGNIVDNFLNLFKAKGKVEGKDYEIKWGTTEEKYIKIGRFRLSFYGFNNVTSFNKILGKPFILLWVDESAKIYSQDQLIESFDQLAGGQISYITHPYLKSIHSFNVEGGERHPYKIKYVDGKPNAKHYTFYPYDNPKLNTKEAMNKLWDYFPNETLREQKIFNRWVVAEGRVFNVIPKVKDINDWFIRDIGIGIDYGSVNPTTFVPIALAVNKATDEWKILRLGIYYHDPSREGDTPTTEYYSNQLKLFLKYLGEKYQHKNLTNIVIDSEASHFDNRLIADGIRHELSKKGAGSVTEGVEHLQSMFYKDFLEILEEPSIRYFDINGNPVFSGKDDGLIELESYRYDKIKSENSGINCYVKDLDHSIDALRYILRVFVDTGRCPQV